MILKKENLKTDENKKFLSDKTLPSKCKCLFNSPFMVLQGVVEGWRGVSKEIIIKPNHII